VVVAAPMAGLGRKLVEVAPLDGLQPVGDAMQLCIRGRVVPDARGCALGVADVCFKTGLMRCSA
jgi:hypothetical protein